MAPERLPLSQAAREILEARYLRRDASGRIAETPEEMLRRAASHAAGAEGRWSRDPTLWEDLFFLTMLNRLFLPNSPTLMNSAIQSGQLSACFVLPTAPDPQRALEDMLRIHRTGGGTGFDLTPLPTEGGPGPLESLRKLDEATSQAASQDPRRGANMAVLAVDHPAIVAFVTAKMEPGRLENFNLSVAVPDSFMEAARRGAAQQIVDPVTGRVLGRRDARGLLALMALAVWASGDPGVLYTDRIESDNPTPHLGRLTATNPCGELPLLPYEACTLGSINLSRFVSGTDLDWWALGEVVWIATRFLDDVIEVNRFPLEEIARTSRATRKIGLGVMGFADLLAELDIPYDSGQAVDWAHRVMQFVAAESLAASRALAEERGPFPEFGASLLAARGGPPVRNATRLSVAPTGTISQIAGCSPGIEPYFALALRRRALDGKIFREIVPTLPRAAKRWHLDWRDLEPEVLTKGTVADAPNLPEAFRRLFKTAHEIPWKRHLEVQAAFQHHVDNSVSKTINLPEEASVRDVFDAFCAAHSLGCKGVTLYRQGTRPAQIFEPGLGGREVGGGDPAVRARAKGAGAAPPHNPACPQCGAAAGRAGPHWYCGQCGWSSFAENLEHPRAERW